ncbi:MAG: hypothetical protein DHS20C18_22500 [Saprospiraceae bacterium]|nr:MAG: hypothetical protein DHS20C18_22500 [Saprospiraceae bacterium]
MKQLLLLCLFFCLCNVVFSQNSFSEKLTLKRTDRVELQIYPNPVSSHLSVNDNELVNEINVFNLVGRKVKSFDFVNGEKYYIGDLPKGMYLVQLIDKRNKILTTQRVSKR